MENAIQVIVHAGNIEEDSVALQVQECSDGTADVQSKVVNFGGGDLFKVIVKNDSAGQVGRDESTPSIQTNSAQGSMYHTLFDVALSERFGYVYSVEQAQKLRRKFELDSNISFVATNNIRVNFGQTELSETNHRIFWEDSMQETRNCSRIQFDGVPFIMLARRVLDCQHGRKWKKALKKRKGDSKSERKRRKKEPHTKETRKLGCLANITMREIICFTDFKIDNKAEHRRKRASRRLRAALEAGVATGERRIYVDLPELAAHNHPIDENFCLPHQPLDERVLEKLEELVGQGVVEVEEMKQTLQLFVKNDIEFPPTLSNRRFYPSRSTIRSHIRRCRFQRVRTKEEQEEIAKMKANQARAEEIGKSFCEAYYKTFDADRGQLAALYHPTHSIMSFEGTTFYGAADITNHLKALPFQTVAHAMTSIDCHCTVDNSILVAVLGQLMVDTDPKQTFHQTFMLKQDGTTFFITNDMFRIGLHNF
ncbi:uncharacterized protein LOC117289743 [Asterias rubens]|uniref:uncharacterized protein LOC117289743 n=1 Tax=Asterias rubens TaxID=7604 RepID=UPI00145543AD|nr:uncharacterized protein LOC117289743 [Asterias rubens]XP_033626895.1 uncharacterized protein LOC117289743 [Asterias rubens]